MQDQGDSLNFSCLKVRCQSWLPNSVASDKTERYLHRMLYPADLKHLLCPPSDLDGGEESKFRLGTWVCANTPGNASAAVPLAPPCSLVSPACYACSSLHSVSSRQRWNLTPTCGQGQGWAILQTPWVQRPHGMHYYKYIFCILHCAYIPQVSNKAFYGLWFYLLAVSLGNTSVSFK